MVTSTKTNAIIGGVFGAVLIFYLIANTFNDAGSELATVNESIKGGSLMKLLPLFLAFGVIIGVYSMFVKGK